MPERLALTPELLLQAYASGIFPMADSADSPDIFWYDPPWRGVIPLDQRFHVPTRLRRTLRTSSFTVTLDTAFRDTMLACAEPTAQPTRQSTWINAEIIELYTALHRRGHAHAIEVWDGEQHVGGLYGVSLGAAFFGESMFSRRTDASKIALVYLVALLRHSSFTLLDTQFQTEHLRQFGTLEIPRREYHRLLAEALLQSQQLKPLSFETWRIQAIEGI